MNNVRRPSRSECHRLRGLNHHLRIWDPLAGSTPGDRTVFLFHGWMDDSSSFQFVVDELPAEWRIIAPDWRGFGLTDWSGTDSYWFADYLADLDAVLDQYLPAQSTAVLAGHSMGGNLVSLYGGIRPERVRALINLEGLGLPPSRPQDAPARYRQWLDELKTVRVSREYRDVNELAQRLRDRNKRLDAERAALIALNWSQETPGGQRTLRGDPAHHRVNPYLYQADEVTECWRRIQAPVLWVHALGNERACQMMASPDYQARLSVISNLQIAAIEDSGHMMHHDQPQAVARLMIDFLVQRGVFP